MTSEAERPVYLRYLERHPRMLSVAGKAYDRYLGLGLPSLRPRPEPAERSELEWVNGVWDYLGRPHELARYSLLAGYYRYFVKAGSRILDVGCGEGLLRAQLDHFSEYIGIDISATAVRRAGERWNDERTSFIAGDINMAPGIFDAVFANEIMQLLPDPGAFVQGVFDVTAPGGYFLVSIHHDTPRNRRLWRDVDERFSCLDAVRVKSEAAGRTWRVACYQKPAG
jgi:SAM-dependent methyltransferase